ncbi:hypothetical protein EXIGLDRAFT_730798, partial [Exidia glandulosa HHB12029]
MVDYTRQLPAELCLKLLDSLDLADVIRVSLVSRWWRLIAFDHPTYWATVTLDTRSASHEPGYACAYYLAAAQLERSSRSPIAIHVSGEFREEIPFEHALLLLIQSNMHRVKTLDIASESSSISTVFLCDAPILEELHLKWCPDPDLMLPVVVPGVGDEVLVLPASFPAKAPRLRLLHVEDVRLSPGFPPFSALTSLIAFPRFCQGVCLPEVFPCLRELVIGDFGVYRFPQPLTPLWVHWITRLERVSLEQHTISVNTSCHALFNVPRLEVSLNMDTTASSCIVASITGTALHASLRPDSQSGLHIFDPSTGRTRVLAFYRLIDFIVTWGALFPRVHTFELDISDWIEFAIVIHHTTGDPLSSLTTITLRLDESLESVWFDPDKYYGDKVRSFVCPRLQVLRLVGSDACRVQPVSAVLRFIRDYLGRETRQHSLSKLELDGVSLEGDVAELRQYV